MAVTMNDSKSVFLANMSHEIRTPLNAIKSATEILLFREDLPEDVNESLELIYDSSELLVEIINDILDFSKVEAGKLNILCQEYNVAGLINDSINLNMSRKEKKDINFIINIDDRHPLRNPDLGRGQAYPVSFRQGIPQVFQ